MPQNLDPEIILQNTDYQRLLLVVRRNATIIHTLLVGIASSFVQLPIAIALSCLEQNDDEDDNTQSYNGMLKWLGIIATFVSTNWALPSFAVSALDKKYPSCIIVTPSQLIAEKLNSINQDISLIENKILLDQYIADLNKIVTAQDNFFKWVAVSRFLSILPSSYHAMFYSLANNSPAIGLLATDAAYSFMSRTISNSLTTKMEKEDPSIMTKQFLKILQYVFTKGHIPIEVFSIHMQACYLNKVFVKINFSYQGDTEDRLKFLWLLRVVMPGYIIQNQNNHYTALLYMPFYPDFNLHNTVIQKFKNTAVLAVGIYPFLSKLKKTLEYNAVPFAQINSIECLHTEHLASLILYNILDPDFLSIMQTLQQKEPNLISIKEGEVHFLLSGLNDRTLPLITEHLKRWRTMIDNAYNNQSRNNSTEQFAQASSSSKPPRNPDFTGGKNKALIISEDTFPIPKKPIVDTPLPIWPEHTNKNCIIQEIEPINDKSGGASIYIAYPQDFAQTYTDPEIPKQITYDKEVCGDSGSGIKALRNKKGQITAYETTDHHSNTRVLFIVVAAVQTPRQDNPEKMKTRFLLNPFIVGNHKDITAALKNNGRELQDSCEILNQRWQQAAAGRELKNK